MMPNNPEIGKVEETSLCPNYEVRASLIISN
jgi:hypothetical protein